MQIERPTVGPLLGHTTAAEARVFVRGDLVEQNGSPLRCFGLLALRERNGSWRAPVLAEIDPAADYSCVLLATGLAADTDYEYRAGWCAGEPSPTELAGFAEQSWPADTLHSFHTGVGDTSDTRSYMVGSCRHLRSPSEPSHDHDGDIVFRSIREMHQPPTRFDALLMLGDQIYADAGWLSPVTEEHEFHALYRCAFTHPHLRSLMASVPTYMTLDDHEIQENWPAYASRWDLDELLPHALAAYRTYQRSHSPTLATRWYEFSDGCAEWFVMDTRSERDLASRRIVSQEQLVALMRFLENGSGKVKLVATAVPMFPDYAVFGRDKWQGFTQQRRAILECIRDQGIRRVVFVSGDIHCSFAARLDLGGGVSVHTVVSSPFVSAPFLGGAALTPLSFWLGLSDWDSDDPPQLLTSDVFSEEGFARLTVRPDMVEVSFYDRAGQAIQENLGIPL